MTLRAYGYWAALAALSAPPSGAADMLFDMSAGARHDSLRWNIASDITGTSTPNILSELTWDSVRSAQLATNWQRTSAGLHVRAAAAYGWIISGDNQDSDYLGNNRTAEFSRSNNDSNGDNVWDVAAAAGYRFDYTSSGGVFSVTPLAGLSVHRQNLRITNGRQTIPALGPFNNLNSTYRSGWRGPWVGVELEQRNSDALRAYLRLEYHRADYYAEADWNLRADFAHPKSFEHDADGVGTVVSFGVASPTASGRWFTRFSIDYQRWTTDPGTDTVFFANGTVSQTRLNEVEWKSWALSGGVQYRF
jgi:hypothetical protein